MASTYLSRTPGSASNRQIFTFSFWAKRSRLGYEQYLYCTSPSNAQTQIIFTGGDIFGFDHYTTGYTTQVRSTQVFRDPSAWYHFVVAIDTTQATASNRVKLYVNGSQITDLSSSTYPSQNFDYSVNNTVVQNIGRWIPGPDNYYDGCLSNYYFIDGTALTPTSFGETDATTGIWKPKSYSGSYGTNGFFLKFENSGSLGTDSSGNGNNFTVNGTPTQTLDTPSNVFATMNPLFIPTTGTVTFSAGNLQLSLDANDFGLISTMGVIAGKWYWEVKWTADGDFDRIGVKLNSQPDQNPHQVGIGWNRLSTNTGMSMLGTTQAGSWGSAFSVGDIISFALDCDNKALYIAQNGTWRNSGVPTSGASKTGGVDYSAQSTLTSDYLFPSVGKGNAGTTGVQFNFGNGRFGTTAISSPVSDGAGLGKFQYTVPTGYYSLCTKNINIYG